ncbi:MAG: redoxin domain-containing protein [Clostridia bacterium]|nr:redoxin domain-containing protein [Clostridia bacterium]MBR1686490.1 redoxin domain-containing protein [Clostridia bacterium]
MLPIGIPAPDFSLPDQNGVLHTLSQYQGQKVILYFYPKDMTSGCTKQACAFAELYPQFREKGAVILGVSRDSVASHKRFEEKYGLPFPLLSDPDMTVIRAYDVQKPAKDGKPSNGLIRSTYLIGEDGEILRSEGSVNAANNPSQMLDALQALSPEEKKPARLQVAYASKTGHVEKIVQRLGLTDAVKIIDGSEKLEGPYVLFTYTTGKGKTPNQVDAFLASHPGILAVVGSGSRAKSHVETFNFAAEHIAAAYGIPVLGKLDGVGTDADYDALSKALAEL